MKNTNMEFKETQGFNRPWHYIIYIILFLLTIGVSIGVYFFENKSTETLIAGFICTGLVSWFWFTMKLKTRIDSSGIHYRYVPFHRKERTLSWENIETLEVKLYSPFGDYGGWGLRFKLFNFNDILMNVSGNMGIRVEMKNGKTFMIGTRKAEKAKRVIENLKGQIDVWTKSYN